MSESEVVEIDMAEDNSAPPAEVSGRFDLADVEDPTASIRKAEELVQMMSAKCQGDEYIATIQGKQYPKVDWWTTVGASLGLFPRQEDIRLLDREGEVAYEATVGVYSGQELVTRASAICSDAEPTWSGRDEYAIRSMALTRATGKAFRLGLSFLPVMAGMEPTPAEEMPRGQNGTDTPFDCPDCGGPVWDNRDKIESGEWKENAPTFTCKAKDECGWKTWPSGDELMDEIGEALSELTGWDTEEGNRLSEKASENHDKLMASEHHAEQFLAALERRIEAAKDAVEEQADAEQGDFTEEVDGE